VTVVGKFDKDKAFEKLNHILQNWNPGAKFVRLESKSFPIKGETIELKARDQASAVYMRGANLKASFNDPDFEALTIAADILGGGSLDSRLAQGVREEKGLSYQIGCQFQTADLDAAGQFMLFAVMNPKNKAALVSAVDEVCAKVKKDGFTQEELRAAITTYEKSTEAFLSEDASLCGVLQRYARRGVDLQFMARRIDRVRGLTVEQVNAAVQKLLSLDTISVLAGDFTESTPAPK
jgi:zinc protease